MRVDRLVGPRTLAALAATAALAAPAAASAHGGISVAEGGGGGVRIVVQGSASTAADGAAAVDLATTLDGPGSGEGSRVVYWIRPKGRERAFRVRAERDAGGVHHVDVRTDGRGSWQDWDVSAYVTLSTGRRLRVTSDREDPPGPPPATTSGGTAGGATTGAAPASTAPSPATTSTGPAPAGEDVEDVSGEGDGAPGWVVPSVVVLLVLAVGATVLRRRRLPDDPRD